MNKNKVLFLGLLSLALVCGMFVAGCPGDTGTWAADPPTLTRLVIDGVTVTPAARGTPNTDPSQAVPRNAPTTLSSSGVDGETGEPTLVVNAPAISIGTEPTSADKKYAVTPSLTPPSTYGNWPASLKNGDILWIQITADGVSNYYVIKIEVKFRAVGVFAIKNHPTGRRLTLAEWNALPADDKALTVEMEEPSAYQYQWYSNTSSEKSGQSITGATQASYTPDNITATGDYYYYVEVTYVGEKLTSSSALIRVTDTAVSAAPIQFTIGTDRLNYVRGIGGTGSFMFRTGDNADASPDADVEYIDLLMGTLGANILRIMVQDDYESYINNEVQSRNSATFYHNAKDNFFPVIRRVNEYGGYVYANPWTAPAHLKTNNSVQGNSGNGGRLTETPQNFVDFANWFREFLTWLNENDAPIFALGILNEPDYGTQAAYEGMGMTGDVTRDWFRTVGHFTTQRVTNRAGAGVTSSVFAEDIIPGYGGGGPTHHVLVMSGDTMGSPASYYSPQIESTGEGGANNRIQLVGRHYYASPDRYTEVAGSGSGNDGTPWKDRPQPGGYEGPFEAESLAFSPQMYAPGSTPGNIKREVWQTEHDFNSGSSTSAPASNTQRYWNFVFAMMYDIDWALRMNGESVFDWWFSSSFSGMVTSWHPNTNGWPPHTITPRGKAFAHYGRYVNETWFLPITLTAGTVVHNPTGGFDAANTDLKISAFEDVNGKFISIVMYTPSTSPAADAPIPTIGTGFGAGGTSGNDDPTRGSINVGRIAVVLPQDFVATGATAMRSYGHDNSTGASYDAGVPTGSPRYWIDEPVFLSDSSVEVTLPGGNIISIMVRGEWTDPTREFTPPDKQRVRPHTADQGPRIK